MIRIVKLTFDPARAADFEAVFTEKQDAIRHFPGCSHVELWKDRSHAGVYFTYSIWDGPDSLDAYRHSPLFKDVWAGIRGWFAGRPEAWSVEQRF
ncbi:putative quinol monooxygenase [Chitinophaga lutea]